MGAPDAGRRQETRNDTRRTERRTAGPDIYDRSTMTRRRCRRRVRNELRRRAFVSLPGRHNGHFECARCRGRFYYSSSPRPLLLFLVGGFIIPCGRGRFYFFLVATAVFIILRGHHRRCYY